MRLVDGQPLIAHDVFATIIIIVVFAVVVLGNYLSYVKVPNPVSNLILPSSNFDIHLHLRPSFAMTHHRFCEKMKNKSRRK